jgi:hypothetical protein
VSARELGLLVRHLQLPTAQPLLPANLEAAQRAAKKSINALAVAFIAGMEAHNTGEACPAPFLRQSNTYAAETDIWGSDGLIRAICLHR